MDDTLGSVGVYVDVANITINGGRGMRYDVLRDFAARSGDRPARLNIYTAFDKERAAEDHEYRTRAEAFHDRLRDYGYKVIIKPVRWYTDEEGVDHPKANIDLDMAVDVILQARSLSRVILVTGDGDFVRVVHALQNMGTRVEVIAFQNVSRDLREAADFFFSGYLVPGLLPISHNRQERLSWGETGSRVRGICYAFHHDNGYGFLRFIKGAEYLEDNLWITDSRDPDSPYRSAFVHHSKLPEGVSSEQLPSRRIFFEFDLAPPRSEGSDNPEAINVELSGRI